MHSGPAPRRGRSDVSLEFEPWPVGLHSRAILLARDIVGAGSATQEHLGQLVRILQRTELADYPLQQVQSFAASVLSTYGPTEQDGRGDVAVEISRMAASLEAFTALAEATYDPLADRYDSLCAASGGRLTPLARGESTSRTDRRDLLVALGSSLHLDREPFLVPLPILNQRTALSQAEVTPSMVRDLMLDIEFVSTGLLVIELWNRGLQQVNDFDMAAFDDLPDNLHTPNFQSLWESSLARIDGGDWWDRLIGVTIAGHLFDALLAANSQ